MTHDVTAPSPSGGRQRNRRGHGARLREELLDAAAAMVAETGDAAVLSLRSVAARVGIAATSVYLHFADIDALKVALAQRGFVVFAAARDAAAQGISDPADALLVRCCAYVQFALDHPGLYRLMFGPGLSALTFAGQRDAPSLAALDALGASIARCQDTGAAAADIPPTRLALLVWTSLHGQATLRLDRPHYPWPPLSETITGLVSRLVQLHGPSSPPSPASPPSRRN